MEETKRRRALEKRGMKEYLASQLSTQEDAVSKWKSFEHRLCVGVMKKLFSYFQLDLI